MQRQDLYINIVVSRSELVLMNKIQKILLYNHQVYFEFAIKSRLGFLSFSNCMKKIMFT